MKSLVPIFRNGSWADPLKYKLVSLKSVNCKSLNRIIVKLLHDCLQDCNLLSQDQYGFHPGGSTEDQLLLKYNDITLTLDIGKFIDFILFDSSEAFDVVCHVLLDKSRHLGITGIITDIRIFFIIGL